MVRWLSGGRSTVEHQRVYLASAARAWADRHDVFDFGIALVDDDTLMGMVGIQSGMAYLAVGQVNSTYGLCSSAVPERLGFTFSHHTTAEDDGEGELDLYVLKG